LHIFVQISFLSRLYFTWWDISVWQASVPSLFVLFSNSHVQHTPSIFFPVFLLPPLGIAPTSILWGLPFFRPFKSAYFYPPAVCLHLIVPSSFSFSILCLEKFVFINCCHSPSVFFPSPLQAVCMVLAPFFLSMRVTPSLLFFCSLFSNPGSFVSSIVFPKCGVLPSFSVSERSQVFSVSYRYIFFLFYAIHPGVNFSFFFFLLSLVLAFLCPPFFSPPSRGIQLEPSVSLLPILSLPSPFSAPHAVLFPPIFQPISLSFGGRPELTHWPTS